MLEFPKNSRRSSFPAQWFSPGFVIRAPLFAKRDCRFAYTHFSQTSFFCESSRPFPLRLPAIDTRSAMEIFILEILSHLFLEPASRHSCNTLFSTLRRALRNRKSARTHGASGNTQNIRRAFRGIENTICIRSPRKCLCPSESCLDIGRASCRE